MAKPKLPELIRISSTEDFGKLLRARRLEAGLDQVTAAGIAGVGVRFLGDIERGKPTVRFDLVVQVLQRFGLDLMLLERTLARTARIPPKPPPTSPRKRSSQ